MNQAEVISFALQITEGEDLLAICRRTFIHFDTLVLCKTEGKIGWEICWHVYFEVGQHFEYFFPW